MAKVLSLFDGMSCGMLAMMDAGVDVDSYVSYEIDEHAIRTSMHNFPGIIQMGDVFKGNFYAHEGFDFLFGGSPCTYWSIAKIDGRETKAEGVGWDLFCQYIRALKEAKPKYFIYENNASMSNEIRESICRAFGFSEIRINSSLVSAQNRDRLYWVGMRNGEQKYEKVSIPTIKDRGILLKDILNDGIVVKDKAYCLKHQEGNARDHFKKHHTDIKYEPVNVTTSCRDLQKDIETNGFMGRQGVAGPVTFATPCEWDEQGSQTKAVSAFDGKAYKVYLVNDEKILVNGVRYPSKLKDGYYIIRPLTVRECARLQVIPDWYEFPVSKTQAFKCIGNGWTIPVISHLIKACLQGVREPYQLKFDDM